MNIDNANNIPEEIKKNVISLIISRDNPFNLTHYEEIPDFLCEIWDLEAMPSEDARVPNAYADVHQHMVNNHDWDYEYLLFERLDTLRNDLTFIKLIETIINTNVHSDQNSVKALVLELNIILKKSNVGLTLSSFDVNGRAIYNVTPIVEEYIPNDVTPNNIPIFVEKTPIRNSFFPNSISTPFKRPSFVLKANNWDDYTNKTQFSLFYITPDSAKEYIGDVKISDGKSSLTYEQIDDEFNQLDESWFSLGQSDTYYKKLMSVTGENFKSILFGLRDVAFFTDIQEKNENNNIYRTSLIREDRVERLSREVRYLIQGISENLYNFEYKFKPPYSDDVVVFPFNFSDAKYSFDRIYAIIGKNGAGKTQFISRLPLDISNKSTENFAPHIPLFSKIIAVSFSTFDRFKKPEKKSDFNYIYCGLLDTNNKILNEDERLKRFVDSWEEIKKKKRTFEYKSLLYSFIDAEIIEVFLSDEPNTISCELNIEEFVKAKTMLSSGQEITLYTITDIVSNIRFDSLLLFDEPETHLHPNAISELLNTLFRLLVQYQSYCILTTHSPLVIQELTSKSVIIMEKHGTTPSLRKIGRECLGENLTILTEEVFGRKDVPRNYKDQINKFIQEGKSYNEILYQLESDNCPLSMNVKMFIKSKLI